MCVFYPLKCAVIARRLPARSFRALLAAAHRVTAGYVAAGPRRTTQGHAGTRSPEAAGDDDAAAAAALAWSTRRRRGEVGVGASGGHDETRSSENELIGAETTVSRANGG